MSIVYMTKEIIPESLVRIYHALGISLPGSVTVKVPIGEPGGRNFLQPELIRNLVQRLKGTIVGCNTTYKRRRNASKDHWETMRDHGFTVIVPCDILDEEDHIPFLVIGGFHLAGNYVGSHLQSYGSMLMLSHFKDRTMEDFGGTLKNMSIDPAPSYGEIWIHSSGTSTRFRDVLTANHDSLLESMADADRSVTDCTGRGNIIYINVANRLPMDCNCGAHSHDPEAGDVGTFASTNPVALDQTRVNMVYASEDGGKVAPIERIESWNGIHAVEAAHSFSLDSCGCELRCIKPYQITVQRS